jgi:uncharacterized protein YbjT (DUF2867 family)
MSDKKVILVVGATGQQGGSVARHLLAQGTYAVRALTRNPQSDKAQKLKEAGAEIVKGDLADAASLTPALSGCYGVFGVTNFWEHFNSEYEHGMNLVKAVAEAHISHFVFSSLPDPKQFGNGGFDVPHFEMKARIEQHIRQLGLKATFVHVAFYYENFLYFLPPQKQADGSFGFGFPQGDTRLAAVAAEDLGGIVAVIFRHPETYIGKLVGVVGDDQTPATYAEIMTKVFNKKVVYNYIPRDVFAKFPFPGADDLANMFEMNRLHILSRSDDLSESRRLYPTIQSFETWLVKNRQNFSGIFAG